jgi:phospholipid/cholesterol/gamma-HCH transport system ATP-binding protein
MPLLEPDLEPTSRRTPSSPTSPPAVEFEHVSLAFDDDVVLRDLSFSIPVGGMTILLGASGSGKSVVLRMILGLLRPDSGVIRVNGTTITSLSEREIMPLRADIGMLFQESALFDSLTVAENVGYRLSEETDTPPDQVRRRVEETLGFVGLGEYPERMPSELSGGQRRRVAIARAMASKPNFLLFDDPTSGLDPLTATSVDDEVIKLRDLERVTSIVVTHQIRDAMYLATNRAVRNGADVRIEPIPSGEGDRATFMVLHQGHISFEGSAAELLAAQDAYLREFLFMTLPPW